ncbi:CAF17-like 4Fe-4S cluster assembly/insertion protein YgfZ [Kiloniella sp. b19]|uniref:CAF17-like 4Fe-4S cluster assembly/insertion protein YgfZ n=1 Tax=Kiloniella sp. GXU_MW_B19 TaxID=3141326 RepID=UPI0031D5DBFD
MSASAPSTPVIIELPDRGALKISGADAEDFLQGLVSQDVQKVTESRSLWSAFLTPQGKYLHDFFLIRATDGAFLLEGEADRLPDLLKRLKLYKLRSKVELENLSGTHTVLALVGQGIPEQLELSPDVGATRHDSSSEATVLIDPRHRDMGARVLLPSEKAEDFRNRLGLPAGSREDYDRVRIALALPDGRRDLQPDKALLLENGFDELGGVDWKKGCFIGQELTARTKYRALLKKRLVTVQSLDGSDLESGSTVTLNEKNVGEVMSVAGPAGLALMRLNAIEAPEAELSSNGHPVRICVPDWLVLPA